MKPMEQHSQSINQSIPPSVIRDYDHRSAKAYVIRGGDFPSIEDADSLGGLRDMWMIPYITF